MAVSSGWEIRIGWVAERRSGGVVVSAGATGRGLGDVEGFADTAAEDFTDHDCTE